MSHKGGTTFQDIADYTHLSKTTISRYFNAPQTLTPASRQRIKEALQALDYRGSNKVGRMLANGQTELIGILTPRFYYHFYSHLINDILDTFRENSYKFIVFTCDADDKVEQRAIEELITYRVEGLLVLSHTLPSRKLASLKLPIVAIERESEYVCSVDSNNYSGAVGAAEKLISDGCEVLVHINSTENPNAPSMKRIRGFEDTCHQHGVCVRMFLHEYPQNFTLAHERVDQILASVEQEFPNKKIGFFVSNDTFAQLLINRLVREGRHIPEQFEVIGFDDSPIAQQAVVPISAVRQNVHQMASTAMRMLDQQIELHRSGKDATPPLQHAVIEPSLVLRESTLPGPQRP